MQVQVLLCFSKLQPAVFEHLWGFDGEILAGSPLGSPYVIRIKYFFFQYQLLPFGVTWLDNSTLLLDVSRQGTPTGSARYII